MHEAEKVCCVVFEVAVTAIVLFVVSFHYVDELSYCLRYDVNTKVMADKVARIEFESSTTKILVIFIPFNL